MLLIVWPGWELLIVWPGWELLIVWPGWERRTLALPDPYAHAVRWLRPQSTPTAGSARPTAVGLLTKF